MYSFLRPRRGRKVVRRCHRMVVGVADSYNIGDNGTSAGTSRNDTQQRRSTRDAMERRLKLPCGTRDTKTLIKVAN